MRDFLCSTVCKASANLEAELFLEMVFHSP